MIVIAVETAAAKVLIIIIFGDLLVHSLTGHLKNAWADDAGTQKQQKYTLMFSKTRKKLPGREKEKDSE